MKLTKTRLKEIIREELSKTPEDNLLEHETMPNPGLWLHVAAADIKRSLDTPQVVENKEYTRDLGHALELVVGVRTKLREEQGR